MREIDMNEVGEALKNLLNEDAPVDEDIGIVDEAGQLVGVVITPDAYEFFLRKVEEEEDRIDLESVEEFKRSGEKNE